jgi:hypothetical protein
MLAKTLQMLNVKFRRRDRHHILVGLLKRRVFQMCLFDVVGVVSGKMFIWVGLMTIVI